MCAGWVLAQLSWVLRDLRADFQAWPLSGHLKPHGGNEQKLNFDVVGETKVDLNNFRSRMGVRMKIIWVCHR